MKNHYYKFAVFLKTLLRKKKTTGIPKDFPVDFSNKKNFPADPVFSGKFAGNC
jgi:hypothetical protein